MHPRSKAGLCCRLVFEMDALTSGASFLHPTDYGLGHSWMVKIGTAVWMRVKGRQHRSWDPLAVVVAGERLGLLPFPDRNGAWGIIDLD